MDFGALRDSASDIWIGTGNLSRALLQHIRQVLSGMLAAGEEQSDLAPSTRYNPRSEDTGAFASFLRDGSLER